MLHRVSGLTYGQVYLTFLAPKFPFNLYEIGEIVHLWRGQDILATETDPLLTISES